MLHDSESPLLYLPETIFATLLRGEHSSQNIAEAPQCRFNLNSAELINLAEISRSIDGYVPDIGETWECHGQLQRRWFKGEDFLRPVIVVCSTRINELKPGLHDVRE